MSFYNKFLIYLQSYLNQKEEITDMGAGKSKLDGTSMTICFEGDSRAFDANHPIVGTINIDSAAAIPAYGIQLNLQLIDSSKKIDRGGKGEPIYRVWKRRAWELN